MVSTSLGTFGCNCRTGTGSCRNTISMVSNTVAPLNGGAPCQTFVEDGTERIHLGRRSNLRNIARRLFRSHIRRRAHDRAAGGEARTGVDLLGEAEVGDLWKNVV